MSKNSYFALILIALIQFSCSKKTDPIKDPEKNPLYSVNLSVRTFNEEIVPLSNSGKLASINQISNTNTPELANQIKGLQYFIYNASGVLTKESTQLSSSTSFRTIKEDLLAGDYKVFIIGYTEEISVLSKESSKTAFVTPAYQKNVGDWFTKTIDLKVSEQGQTESILLKRIVGKVEVNITDAIPTGINKITVSNISKYAFSLFNAVELEELRTHDFSVSNENIGKTGFIMGYYIFPGINGSITSDLTIKGYNSEGSVGAEKIVKNVKVDVNKKTILTGQLFTSKSVSSSFTIGINSDWAIETNNVSF